MVSFRSLPSSLHPGGLGRRQPPPTCGIKSRGNDQRQIIPNKTLTGENAIDMDTSNRVEISTKGNVAGSASYVNVVKGVLGGKGNDKRMEDGSVQEERKLCLKAEGNGWLYRSAVAKLHKLISIDELKVQMARMGVNNVLVRAMGGRSVILTCNNNEELENLLKVNCLQRWFSEIKSWEGQAACIERFVWLCCYGIPLNGWSNTSFKAIGELWGDMDMPKKLFGKRNFVATLLG
ncbi:hypothetical protein RHSIM_Rhsim01G0047800 [Rhododendron simsii]|uniref:DUF4283 domain-containing protein n=2 Tax=Rhododendron simsii TaxID=118357 RepID=A0A834HGL7_RHOSS|nr:hypothetical protein RHSIM_Rhsim01G0047800 [Rhododendron simsii]